MTLQIRGRGVASRARRGLRAGFAGVVCGTLLFGGAAMAQDPDVPSSAGALADKAAARKAAQKAHPKKVAKAYVSPKGPVYKDVPVAESAGPACGEVTAYQINQKYGIKGWVIPAVNEGDSITQDYGCWRTNLAKYGFGFLYNGSGVFTANLVNHYVPQSAYQQYNGQKPTSSINTTAYLFYDLSQFGLPDGQFEIAGGQQNTTYAPNYASNVLQMESMKIYGTAFDKKIEYEVGYIQNFLRFQGTFIGGNISNPLGPQSGSAAEVGESFPPQAAPSFNIKYHITDAWYDRFALQRSDPGTVNTGLGGLPNMPAPFGSYNKYLGNMFAVEHYSNPTGFNFTNSTPCKFGVCYHSPRELFINEIGYQVTPTPSSLSTWVRLTGYYNNTSYWNQKAGHDRGAAGATATTDNYAVSLYADQQIWQMDPSAIFTAYKGLYVGGTVAYDDPRADPLVWDFEARIYSFGMFGRPRDQIALSFQHQTLSQYLSNPNTNAAQDGGAGLTAIAACSAGIVCARHATNTYALTYTANIIHGVYFTIGGEYIDHPAGSWSPTASQFGSAATPAGIGAAGLASGLLSPLNINHAINLVSSLYFNF